MATTQQASASIVPTVSTASFKPLSLDEIMMVPLAKQGAHDQLVMDMDELNLMASNAIGKDKDYVNAQKAAYEGEIAGIRNNLMESGVDRGMINKFKTLRSKKNLEFSPNGTTGRANAAYNQMQLNKKALMARKDLDEDTKRLGLAEAEKLYEEAGGALSGAEYEDFYGVGTVDYMAEAQKIGAQMNPQQIAAPLGLTYDEKTGAYKDGSNSTVILTPEQIQRVTYDTLKGNVDTMAYLNEQERLGRIPSAEQAIKDAAISAGNIYQRNNSKRTESYPSWANQPGGGGVSISNQYWDSAYNVEGEAVFAVETGVDDEAIANVGFMEDGSISPQSQMPEDLQPTDEDLKGMSMARRQTTLFSRKRWLVDHEDAYNANMDIAKMRRDFPLMQGDNPATGKPYTDKEIYETSVAAKKKMAQSAAQVYLPRNLDNSYTINKKNMLRLDNDKTANGSYIDSHLSINGYEGDIKSVAEQMEVSYDDLTKAIRETGRLRGIAIGHPTMPGSDAFGITIDGEQLTMYVASNNKVSDSFSRVANMNKALMEGERFVEGSRMNNAAGTYAHIATELNPYTNELDQFQIESPRKITHAEYRDLKWVKQDNPSVIFAIDSKGNKHYKRTKREIEQYTVQNVMNSWDATIQGKTPHSSLKR